MKTATYVDGCWVLDPPVVYVDDEGCIKGATAKIWFSSDLLLVRPVFGALVDGTDDMFNFRVLFPGLAELDLPADLFVGYNVKDCERIPWPDEKYILAHYGYQILHEGSEEEQEVVE